MMLSRINDKQEIRQSNVLTEARFEMSATELDILFYLLSILKKDSETKKYQIPILELQNITQKEYQYTQLREATEKMGSRMYEYNLDNGDYLQIWLFSSCLYKKGLGIIEIELSEKIKPFLFDLRERFTSFRLYAALNMSSKYAKRIYTMLSQWKDKGVWKISIEEMKIRLKILDPKGKEPELYKQIVELKHRVLDPAISQINKYTELNVSYKLLKRGRKFQDIEFDIDVQNDKAVVDIDFNHNSEEQRCLKSLEEIGVVRKDIVSIIIKDESLRKKTFKWVYEWKLGKFGKVGNPAGLYLKTMGLV
ncbi:hypothetical protein AD998_20275 [bacterium 336/3]|nr:hypothetical protein AD998_20275 [bacterium 336/3]